MGICPLKDAAVAQRLIRIRKVKCDEEVPHCRRCTSTGRKCDGYPRPPETWHSWQDLLARASVSPPPRIYGVDATESRSVDFYEKVVAAKMTSWFDGTIWDRLIMQVTLSHAPIRDAVIALSSTFERSGRGGQAPSPNISFMVSHYNRAIRQIMVSSQDVEVVIVACFLFIVIETLQCDRETAYRHARHGIVMLESLDSRLVSIRKQLMPLLFRVECYGYRCYDTSAELPYLSVTEQPSKITGWFHSFTEARFELDKILSRTVRFMRASETYRLVLVHKCNDKNELLAERQLMHSQLDQWRVAYSNSSLELSCPDDTFKANSILRIIFLTLKIWANVSLEHGEVVYDNHQLTFKEIIDNAIQLMNRRTSSEITGGKAFILDVELLPMLYFSIAKCRSLPLRLEGLRAIEASTTVRDLKYKTVRAMQTSHALRGSYWEAIIFYIAARRVVEREHNIDLNDSEPHATRQLVPPDEDRIRAVKMTNQRSLIEMNGIPFINVKLDFLHHEKTNATKVVTEWVPLSLAAE
jgi:hypothetical protein